MKISIVGAGVSGISLALLAKKLGHDVFVSDMRSVSDEARGKFDAHGIRYEIGHKDVFDADLIVLSSGIPPKSPVICEAQTRGVQIMGELEFVLPELNGTIIGVTGTNGKSTTTALIGHILSGSYKTAVGGNLGAAMADFACEKFDYIVLELSSAQLHYLKQTDNSKCKAAVVTNLAPDHLDWHGSYEKYVEAKGHLLSFLAPDGFAFVREIDLPQLKIGGKKIFALNRDIVMEKTCAFFDYSDSPLLGKHNLENIAFAISVVKKISATDDDEIKRKLLSFKGLAHRCEFVGEVGGVKYVNDSKGTNVGAAITALEAIDGKKIIILGGKSKGEDYSLLAECVKNYAKHAIIIGSEGPKIAAALEKAGVENQTLLENLEEAVNMASKIAVPGDVVLLSPACTSWDQYKNFEERGEHFRALVGKLKK